MFGYLSTKDRIPDIFGYELVVVSDSFRLFGRFWGAERLITLRARTTPATPPSSFPVSRKVAPGK